MKTLTAILAALKLLGVIHLPWLWVFSPVWIPVLLFAAIFAFILIGGKIVKGHW